MKSRKRQLFILRNRKAPVAFLIPSFLGVLIFVLLPFADVIRRSFGSSVTGEFLGLGNYELVFKNGAFRLAVENTCRFISVCLPFLILLGFLTALVLTGMMEDHGSRRRLRKVGKGVGWVKSMLLFPMAMPAATVVLVWQMVFGKGGFLGQVFGSQVGFMDSESAFWVLVFSYIWKNLGYTVVLWMAGILAVPYSLQEAAKVDGAGRFTIILRILMPNLKGVLYTITVLSFLNSFKVFREAYLVAGSYPHESMYLLQHLFNNWFVALELDKMAAAAVCMGAVLFLVILLFQRLWDREEQI